MWHSHLPSAGVGPVPLTFEAGARGRQNLAGLVADLADPAVSDCCDDVKVRTGHSCIFLGFILGPNTRSTMWSVPSAALD